MDIPVSVQEFERRSEPLADGLSLILIKGPFAQDICKVFVGALHDDIDNRGVEIKVFAEIVYGDQVRMVQFAGG